MIYDIWFYAVGVPAVLIFAIGKGGFGGSLGIISVPLMSLIMPPAQAAAILLPTLCVMDFFVIRHYYRDNKENINWDVLKRVVTGMVAGITIAGFFLTSISPNHLKLFVGILAIIFSMQPVLTKLIKGENAPKPRSKFKALFWSCLSGISSTLIHVGSAPLNIYILPLRLDKKVLVATMAVYFGVANALKLIPYTIAGEFSKENLLASLVLMPIIPIGVKIGVWMLNNISQQKVYRILYWFLFIAGLKLTYDGLM